MHAASGRFQPWPLRVMAVPLSVIVPILVRVLLVAVASPRSRAPSVVMSSLLRRVPQRASVN
jgi:hypothetical protein